ncbi:MAG: type II 3-dehydroquinate dehydratase [Bdellovibrionia bacterium]
MTKLLVLNGPNLNLLGEREPEVYGSMTLPELVKKLKAYAKSQGFEMRAHQSNSEGDLIDLLHKNRRWADAVVFNPGAYTHYSYALRDAVAAIQVPTIEVHLSDIHKREEFRKTSVIAPVCLKQISGLGFNSYTAAIDEFKNHLQSRGKR